MMIIKNIIRIFKNSASTIKTPLGRWNIHNYKETSLKIKYANEDNCGVSCNNNIKNIDIVKSEDEEYIYAMGYESVHN